MLKTSVKLIVAILILSAQTTVSQVAYAVDITPCDDWVQGIDYIVEPWEERTKSYYSGKVRVVHIDTHGEPVCCSSRLLAYMPSRDTLMGERKCFQLGNFQWIDFPRIKSSYDSSRGLQLNVPVTYYDHDGDGHEEKETVNIRFNLSRETLVIESRY